MAKATAWEFVDSELIEEVVLADLDLEKAKYLAVTLNSSKVAVKQVDANDHQGMVREFKSADMVVNSSWYDLNVPIMKACLEAKTHYADLGGLYYKTLEQLKMKNAFREAKITAILGIGASPGLTNICVAQAMSRLDSIEDIHIRTGASGGQGFAYSAKTVLDEATMSPAVYMGGDLKFLEPLSGREKYVLPDPVGEVEGVYSIHSELATLPYLADTIRNVSFRVAFSPKLLNAIDTLTSLGLLSEEVVEINGVKTTARDFIYKFFALAPVPEYVEEHKSFRVDVVGLKNGDKRYCKYEIIVASDPGRKLKATSIWTGVPPAVAAELLLTGHIPAGGVFSPEELDPGPFIRELAKRNLVIKEEVY